MLLQETPYNLKILKTFSQIGQIHHFHSLCDIFHVPYNLRLHIFILKVDSGSYGTLIHNKIAWVHVE